MESQQDGSQSVSAPTHAPPAGAPTISSTANPAVPSAPTATVASPSSTMADEDVAALVAEFEKHDFAADDDFRAGLPAVLKAIKAAAPKGVSSAAKIDSMIAQAQWFYFTRIHRAPVPFEMYLKFRSSELESKPIRRPSAASSTAAAAAAAAESVRVRPAGSTSGSTEEARAIAAKVLASTSPAMPMAPLPPVDSAPPAAAAAPTPMQAAAGDMSFDQVVALIAAGRASEVPTRDIPDGINDAPASVPSLAQRPKPWEVPGSAGAAEVVASDAQDALVQMDASLERINETAGAGNVTRDLGNLTVEERPTPA